jgi:hypothetical protein
MPGIQDANSSIPAAENLQQSTAETQLQELVLL